VSSAKLMAVFLLLLAAPALLGASTDCKKLQKVVESYLAAKHPTTAKSPIRVVVYDTKDKSWHAFRWDGTNAVEQAASLELSFSNEPVVTIRRGEDVAVLVAHANPAVYSSEVTAVTRADVAGLAELKQIALLLGGVVPNIPHVARDTAQPVVQTADVQELLSHLQRTDILFRDGKSARATSHTESARSGLQATMVRDMKAIQLELRGLLADLSDALHGVADPLAAATVEAKTQLDLLSGRAIALPDYRQEITESLQFAEDGTHRPLQPETLAALPGLAASTQSRYIGSAASLAKLGKVEGVCGGSLTSLDTVLRIVRDGEPDGEEEKKSAAKDLRAALRLLEAGPVGDDCSNEPLAKAVIALAKWLRVEENRAAAKIDEENADEILAAEKMVSAYLKVVDQRKGLLTAYEKLADKRAATLREAVSLERFGTLYTDQQLAGSDCWMTAGVVEVKRIQNSPLDLPLFKVQTEEFTVTVRPTFKDDVLHVLPDQTKGKYSFTRGNYGFGVDTALIFTRANDREFKAVARKVLEDVNSDMKIDEKDTRLFVTETARTDRTGKLALMLTASPKGLHHFGAQFGLGVDTDNPSAFLGLTYSIGFIRLSAGHTQQRVTRLPPKVALGSVVETADLLTTRERFDASWYAALAFTISDLPIFKTK
jgi:hypothetical protein